MGFHGHHGCYMCRPYQPCPPDVQAVSAKSKQHLFCCARSAFSAWRTRSSASWSSSADTLPSSDSTLERFRSLRGELQLSAQEFF